MVEIGVGTLVGIGVSIFFFLLGLITKFLYDIATTLREIGTETSTRLDNIEQTIGQVDGRLQDLLQILARIEGARAGGNGRDASRLTSDGEIRDGGDDEDANSPTEQISEDTDNSLTNFSGTRRLDLNNHQFNLSWGHDPSSEKGSLRIRPQNGEKALLDEFRPLVERFKGVEDVSFERDDLVIELNADSDKGLERMVNQIEELLTIYAQEN